MSDELLELESITVTQTPIGTIAFEVTGSPMDAYYDLYQHIAELNDEIKRLNQCLFEC